MTATVTSIHGTAIPSEGFEDALKEVRQAHKFLLQERLRAHAKLQGCIREMQRMEEAAQYGLEARVLDYLLEGHAVEDLEQIDDSLVDLAGEVLEQAKTSLDVLEDLA
jgi:uncharacterized protein YaaR (DUF327 family)